MDNELIVDWLHARDALAEAKYEEGRLRRMVVEQHFNRVFPGLNKIEDEKGILKVTVPKVYAVSKDVPDKWLKHPVFRRKVELNKREYDKIDPDKRSALDDYLTWKEGAPRIEYRTKD